MRIVDGRVQVEEVKVRGDLCHLMMFCEFLCFSIFTFFFFSLFKKNGCVCVFFFFFGFNGGEV